MKAIRVLDDENNSLAWETVPSPSVSPKDVAIDVAATAVNRADLLQRMGRYPSPSGATDILGLEAAGTIAEVGSDVSGWRRGDRVCCLLPGGGYATRVTPPADMLLPVPDNLNLSEAAAIPEVFYTAYLNLFVEANLKPGERALIHAGASGVGTAAIQLCKLHDCPVYATASQPKLSFLRDSLDVDRAIDRKSQQFDEVLGSESVDVALDPVGADYLRPNTRVLTEQGRMILIGLLSGLKGQLSLLDVLKKRLRIIGSVLRSRPVDEKIDLTARFRRQVWPFFKSQHLEPVIHSRFPITEAERAHALLRNNETVGKVVLTVDA